MNRRASRAWPLAAAWLAGAAHAAAPACPGGEAWDEGMAMCMPAAASASPLSAQANLYATYSDAGGPRGGRWFAAPGWAMLAAATSPTPRDQLALELMATAERWTFPAHGYPELLQAGEARDDGSTYIDAQHPHSSPVMGLVFAWNHAFDGDRALRLSLAPRGASTDGPVAFMHRPSARDNPDAPLGHHIGQDVGHISSSVLAARWNSGPLALEASAFSGAEPRPTNSDLPLARPDSWAVRVLVRGGASAWHASYARVLQADEAYPGSSRLERWSGSWSGQARIGSATLDHALVLGAVRRDGPAPVQRSLLQEGTLARGALDGWWRLEALERDPAELGLAGTGTHWAQALTLGATRWAWRTPAWQLGVGASLTVDHVPAAWATAYGSGWPLTGRLIVQLRAATYGMH